MANKRTTPHRHQTWPIRTLALEVVGGPDRGRSCRSQAERLSVGTARGNDLRLTDPTVSHYHIDVIRSPDGVVLEDRNSTNGTYIGSVRVARAIVPPQTLLTLGQTQLRINEGGKQDAALYDGSELAGVWGKTPAMRRLMAEIEKAAATDVPVLLLGESGVGKECVARAIHALGARSDQPFVPLDCGSLTPPLLAVEMLGQSGRPGPTVVEQVGALERAAGGTLLLDDVGELPVGLQAALLGALERRRFSPLGGAQELAVDVRPICSSQEDLRDAINAGRFREELYYQLGVMVLRVPPLRERTADIPLLIQHFLDEVGYVGNIDTLFPQSAVDALCDHYWPGNVRELRHLVEATVALGELRRPDTDLRRAAFLEKASDVIGAVLDLKYGEARSTLLHTFESRYLRRLMERADGNVSAAARLAHVDRSHLNNLLKRHQMRV